MRFRLRYVLLLAALAAVLGAPQCPRTPLVVGVTVEPPPDRSVEVLVFLRDDYDPATLTASLNGEPLDLESRPVSTGLELRTTLESGPPLQEENTLVVTAGASGELREERSFSWDAPPASARRVQDVSECPDGPLAHCRPGDWILENDRARFVVQDGGKRDLHSVAQFGGNLIDAVLLDESGEPKTGDHFLEIQPGLNVETVVNAQSVEVVNDGSDGGAAIVRACGPDDLLDYINPSSIVADLGFSFPDAADDRDADVEACTTYRLEPGDTWVEMETTVMNLASEPVGLYIGDYINGAGALEQWGGPIAGIGEQMAAGTPNEPLRYFDYFGFGEAAGVDYHLVVEPVAGANPDAASFTQSGVSYVLNGRSVLGVLFLGESPAFVVPGASGGEPGTQSFRRYFGVGDGSAANAVALFEEVRGLEAGTLQGCVTVGGEPAEGARVAVGSDDGSTITTLESHFVTGPDGCYEGRVPTGDWSVAAAREGAPYEGGGPIPALHPVTVTSGGVHSVDVALPATGRVEVEVADASGAALPARVSVVGFDPSPPVLLPDSLVGFDLTTALFGDATKDGLPAGFARIDYAGADGRAAFDLEPGDYRLYVSRGTEYSLYSEPITVAPGGEVSVDARLARVLETPGFVSSDYHVHMINSPDSRVSLRRRALSFGGEGVENLIATDHDAVTNVNPTIAELGLDPFLLSTAGEEITTFDYGHFNAYPQGQSSDPDRYATRGSTDWAGAAPPGEDFPSQGHYSLSPAEIEAAVLTDPDNAGHDTVVHVNHIDSHFSPLRIDTSLSPPQSFSDPARRRLDPSVENFFHPFEALELWNGNGRGAQSSFLNERMGIWMNLLNQGIPTTAVADTDTHTYRNLVTAGARSWTPSSFDSPASVQGEAERVALGNEVGAAVQQGKLVGGQGVYLRTALHAASTGQSASHGLADSTLVSTTDGSVELEIDVQAPVWAPYDSVEIYRNAATSVTGQSGDTDVLFCGNPTQTLVAGTDFAVEETVVDASVPGAERLESSLTVPLEVGSEDAWVVVVVSGSPGSSAPMFPVYPSGVAVDGASGTNDTVAKLADVGPSEAGTRALGFTNALYVDADGSGSFDAPGVRERSSSPNCAE